VGRCVFSVIWMWDPVVSSHVHSGSRCSSARRGPAIERYITCPVPDQLGQAVNITNLNLLLESTVSTPAPAYLTNVFVPCCRTRSAVSVLFGSAGGLGSRNRQGHPELQFRVCAVPRVSVSNRIRRSNGVYEHRVAWSFIVSLLAGLVYTRLEVSCATLICISLLTSSSPSSPSRTLCGV